MVSHLSVYPSIPPPTHCGSNHGRVQRGKVERILLFTVDILGGTGEVNGLDTADLLVGDGDDRTSLLGGGPDEVGGGDEGTALGGRGGNLTGQLATESLGETTRSHREEGGTTVWVEGGRWRMEKR